MAKVRSKQAPVRAKPQATRRARMSPGATHVTGTGTNARSRMVDVGGKAATARRAEARVMIRFPKSDAARLVRTGGPKGPIKEIARAAAVLAAKRTSDLIPLCHPLALDSIDVTFTARGKHALEVRCTAACTGRTGVEMEAMVGAAIAALTVYDMTKALDHGITITDLELLEKRGGKSGLWRARSKTKA